MPTQKRTTEEDDLTEQEAAAAQETAAAQPAAIPLPAAAQPVQAQPDREQLERLRRKLKAKFH